MIQARILSALFCACALTGCSMVQGSQEISRMDIPNAPIAISAAVAVPPGYTTYYISGAGPAVADPSTPEGSTARFGNTETQTASTLSRLKATLGKLGLGFADVVAAHVFVVGDPAMGGKMDFAGMNRAWSKEFGTAEQPDKPARSAVQVAGLALPGWLVEIEFVAARRPK